MTNRKVSNLTRMSWKQCKNLTWSQNATQESLDKVIQTIEKLLGCDWRFRKIFRGNSSCMKSGWFLRQWPKAISILLRRNLSLEEDSVSSQSHFLSNPRIFGRMPSVLTYASLGKTTSLVLLLVAWMRCRFHQYHKNNGKLKPLKTLRKKIESSNETNTT